MIKLNKKFLLSYYSPIRLLFIIFQYYTLLLLLTLDVLIFVIKIIDE